MGKFLGYQFDYCIDLIRRYIRINVNDFMQSFVWHEMSDVNVRETKLLSSKCKFLLFYTNNCDYIFQTNDPQ